MAGCCRVPPPTSVSPTPNPTLHPITSGQNPVLCTSRCRRCRIRKDEQEGAFWRRKMGADPIAVAEWGDATRGECLI